MKRSKPCSQIDHIANIELICWGVSVGGEHYTANILCGDDFVQQVEAKLTSHDAALLNKKDKRRSYRKGTKSGRFRDREKAIARCVDVSRERWPHVRLVLVGDAAHPHRVAWCSDDKAWQRMNRLYERVERMYQKTNDPWSKFPTQMQEACGAWDKLVIKLAPEMAVNGE